MLKTIETHLAAFWKTVLGDNDSWRQQADGTWEYRQYLNGPWMVYTPGINYLCRRCNHVAGFYSHICIGMDQCPI